jgi:flavin reductase (DIM6/NTAB) family NADH-FMN oxidoreductase RutF
MTIHGDHPFLPPEAERSPVRRLRGRLPSPVSIWTSSYDGVPAGLTVSSVMIADGEPGYVVGLVDPDSDLWETLRASGRAVVSLLGEPHRLLADAFGYVAPAPGGPFRLADWTDTDWGPALADATAWTGCRLVAGAPPAVGWALQVQLEIEHVHIDPDDLPPIVHRRGRYHVL